jgi:hypothetical protein
MARAIAFLREATEPGQEPVAASTATTGVKGPGFVMLWKYSKICKGVVVRLEDMYVWGRHTATRLRRESLSADAGETRESDNNLESTLEYILKQ